LPSAVSNRAAISEIKNKAAEVKEIKNEVQQGRPARVQVLVGTGSAAVANFTRSSLAQSRRLVAEGRRLYSQAAAKAIRQLPALGWQPPRVRIVLIGLPLRIKILVARQLSEWKMRTPSATPDTGFRAAIILAAACALLGLVCLALAPHFAARFLPSRSLGAGSAVGQKIVVRSVPAAARPSQSAVAARSAPREKEKPPSSTAAAKAKEEKPAPQNRQAPRKHHRTDDDDYVAPDTYKYYGQSGSR
jgi:hypothetical protein